MKIYVSSTWQDLKQYRQAVYAQLRKLRLDVVAMEDYVAGEVRPLAQSIQDVAEADVYVGIFAWRYGYIPKEGNPDGRSITELEYRAAGEYKKERLVFLLREDAPWSPSLMDSHSRDGDRGEQIRRFREELTNCHGVGFFSTADELAKEVSAAISNVLPRNVPRPRHQLDISDVQVIPDQLSGTCTIDFRVSNPLGVDVQVNRITLEVVEVLEQGRVMGPMEFSAIYDLDISSLQRVGDTITCNVSQVVKRGEVDRFGIRVAATRLETGRFRAWKLCPTLMTNLGDIVGPTVEAWLPFCTWTGFSWDEIREFHRTGTMPAPPPRVKSAKRTRR